MMLQRLGMNHEAVRNKARADTGKYQYFTIIIKNTPSEWQPNAMYKWPFL